jgi:hypothetical protein
MLSYVRRSFLRGECCGMMQRRVRKSRAQTLVCHIAAKCAFPMRFERCTYHRWTQAIFSSNLRDGRPHYRFSTCATAELGVCISNAIFRRVWTNVTKAVMIQIDRYFARPLGVNICGLVFRECHSESLETKRPAP